MIAHAVNFCHLICVRSTSVPIFRGMSFENIVTKLRSPVRELVMSASESGGNLLGNDDNDKREVIGWIDKLSQDTMVAERNLKVRYNIL
jgi:hypothetical protein